MSDKLIEAAVEFLGRDTSTKIVEDFTKMKDHELKQWINTRQQNAMAANLSSKRQSQLDQAQAELKKRKTKIDESLVEGLMSALAGKIIKGAANRQTPQQVANTTVSAINKKAPGTKMHNHPNFSKFKQEVHSYVSSAKSGEEAFKRSSDDHVMSLAKKHFNEEVEQVDELKKSTLGSYIKKSQTDKSFYASDIGRMSSAGDTSSSSYNNIRRKHKNRGVGINKAVDRLAKEEVEQVDELKKSTLKSYVNKAAFDSVKQGQNTMNVKDPEASKKAVDKAMKRLAGIRAATRKM